MAYLLMAKEGEGRLGPPDQHGSSKGASWPEKNLEFHDYATSRLADADPEAYEQPRSKEGPIPNIEDVGVGPPTIILYRPEE
jgi:hypothetical protein